MKAITLTLDVDDINLILEALGNMPYVKVSQLIANIHQQANSQLTDGASPTLPESSQSRSSE